MKVSEKIREKILNDNIFSLKVAMVLNRKQKSAIDLAQRNSEKLTLNSLVEFYKQEGFTEDEIFERVAPAGNKK